MQIRMDASVKKKKVVSSGSTGQEKQARAPSKSQRSKDSDFLFFFELLASAAPAHSYDNLVLEARGQGAGTSALERLERARDLALSVQADRDRSRRRETELVSLIDIACDLSVSADLEAALQLVTRRARILVHMDVAHVSLFREDGTSVTIAAGGTTLGATSSSWEGPLLKESARAEGPFWTADYSTDPRIVHTPDTDQAIRAEGLHALLTVPLWVDGVWSGVLCVAERRVHHFTPEEVSLVSALATLTAATVSRTWRWERARAEHDRQECAARAAREEAAETDRAWSTQQELLDMVLVDTELKTLLNRAGQELDGTLAVCCPSGTTLARSGKLSVCDPLELERVCLHTRTLEHPLPLSCGTWVTPLRGLGEHFGWLLFSPREGVEHSPERVLASLGTVVSTQLMVQSRSGGTLSADNRLLEDLIRDEGAEAQTVQHPQVLESRLRRPHVLLAVRAHNTPATQDGTWATPFANQRLGLATSKQDYVVLLLPGNDPGQMARSVAAELSEIAQTPVTVGAAGPLRKPEEASSAHREAVRCLDALIALGDTGSGACARDLGFLGTLFAKDYEVSAFVQDVLGPVLDYDARRRTDLQKTLETFFQCGESPTKAAGVLHVHPNTVSRRLERVTRLLGREWQTPDQALELRLALHLQRTRSSLTHQRT